MISTEDLDGPSSSTTRLLDEQQVRFKLGAPTRTVSRDSTTQRDAIQLGAQKLVVFFGAVQLNPLGVELKKLRRANAGVLW